MKPEDCTKLDTCHKLERVLDKDLLDSQHAEAIRAVWANCQEGEYNEPQERPQEG